MATISKASRSYRGLRTVGAMTFALHLLAYPRAEAQKKIKPEELVRLHLESIGTEEARISRKSAIGRGKCNLRVLVGKEAILPGDASFWTQGKSYRSSMRFPVSNYPAEDISFDGKKTYVGLLNPGQRSRIGQFLYDYDAILKEGLIGGVLSAGWPLLEFKSQKLKLKYGGLKKVYDRDGHELAYQMRKGNYDLRVSLYFDVDACRHLGTVYEMRIPDAPTGAATPSAAAADSPRQVATRYVLEERFGDFRAVGGLTLPFHWQVRLTTEGPAGDLSFVAASRDLSIIEWDVTFETISLNDTIDPKLFILY